MLKKVMALLRMVRSENKPCRPQDGGLSKRGDAQEGDGFFTHGLPPCWWVVPPERSSRPRSGLRAQAGPVFFGRPDRLVRQRPGSRSGVPSGGTALAGGEGSCSLRSSQAHRRHFPGRPTGDCWRRENQCCCSCCCRDDCCYGPRTARFDRPPGQGARAPRPSLLYPFSHFPKSLPTSASRPAAWRYCLWLRISISWQRRTV